MIFEFMYSEWNLKDILTLFLHDIFDDVIISLFKLTSLYLQRKSTMLIYKDITCFFSFYFITRNMRMGRVRKSWRRPKSTHRSEIWIFSKPFLLRFAFVKLAQGYLKALNHLSFSPLLNFRESNIGPSQGIESS